MKNYRTKQDLSNHLGWYDGGGLPTTPFLHLSIAAPRIVSLASIAPQLITWLWHSAPGKL